MSNRELANNIVARITSKLGVSTSQAQWVSLVDAVEYELSRPTTLAGDAACAFDHDMLALQGHTTCPQCGAIPPRP